MSFSQIPNCFFFLSMPNHLNLLAFSKKFLFLIHKAPPSPVVICLIAWKLKIVKSLMDPIFLLLYSAPRACAASSIKGILNLSASSSIALRSLVNPP
jgi:hypothetical protein